MSITSKVVNKASDIIGKLVSGSLSQEERMLAAGSPEVTDEMKSAARDAACEGIVMLENEGVLPFAATQVLSVFGRVQLDYFAVGYGSGGDVNKPYCVNPLDGLRAAGVALNEELSAIYLGWVRNNPADHGFWGHWPRCHPEMPVSEDIVKNAAAKSDAAVVIIGRSAGEDRENTLEQGSYYLTDTELSMLDRVTRLFSKTAVLLNCGNIIDMSWVERFRGRGISVLYVWQGGMENGNATADVLLGKKSPSGKLADTIAKSYEDYPASANFGKREFNNYAEDIFVGYRYFETFAKDRVLYPFGFGLSYTSFEIISAEVSVSQGEIKAKMTVKNTGSTPGRETAQLYCACPDGALSKSALVLAGFNKTKELAPGESEELLITFDMSSLASYDDSGVTGHKSAYVLEKGEYVLFLGNSIRELTRVKALRVGETRVLSQHSPVCPLPAECSFQRLTAKKNGDVYEKSYEDVPCAQDTRRETILAALPAEIPLTGDRGIKLSDVKNGKNTLDEFTAQLTPLELEALCRGDYMMNSPLGAPGNGGTYGGVLESLREKGVPAVTTTDGPSGIRLAAYASLLPIGASLACGWNTEAVTRLYTAVGEEMKEKGSDVLLAPGMNIHRDPLCGRNFEYFSEDPLLSGSIAAAVVSGVQSKGVSACPKHFACNNQETNRNRSDSRVSERALREIYLKGFEICVKKSTPYNIMTSYNKINGVWSHYNYDLATRLLREEWGYKGLVITDWWMRPAVDPDFPLIKNSAYRVRAQVDVLMPGSGAGKRNKKYDKSLLATLGKADGITLGELQRSAKNTLNTVMELMLND